MELFSLSAPKLIFYLLFFLKGKKKKKKERVKILNVESASRI